jgi:hypothetical protein
MKTPNAVKVLAAASLAAALVSTPKLVAQQIELPPSNIVLPNYDSMPIGQTGGLQSGAFVARAYDDTANWYNPAGLSRAEASSISTSAGTYQLLSLDLEALPDKGSSTQQIPALLGILIKKPWGNECWNAGILLVRTNAWLQEIDSQLARLGGTGVGDLLTYSADSEFDRSEGSLGLSYSDGGPWRFGAALSGVYTYLRTVQSFADTAVDPTAVVSSQSAGRQTGSLGQGRLTLGVQYDLTPEISLGALARSPGVTVIRSGSYTIDAISTIPPSVSALSFFDPEIRFNYKLPFEFVAGAAYKTNRLELELDGKLFTGYSPYNLFQTTQTAILIESDAPGIPPTVTRVPVANILTESKTIVNVAVGGSYYLSDKKVWRIHFGFNTDFSPVGDDDQFFDQVNLYAFRAGISGETRHFVGSLGVQYSFGSEIVDFERITDVTQTKLSVSNLGFLYSLGYRF